MNPVEKLKDLRKLLGLDKLKDEVTPPKLCMDTQPQTLCGGKEATNLEDSILHKESSSLLADSYYVCLIEKQEDWNNDLEQVDCIFEYVPACSYFYTSECVCIYGGGEEMIFQGETCDQECNEGDCSGEPFCREGDIECIISQLNNKHQNTDYYEGHTLTNQETYFEINKNKKVCIIDLGFQRTNNCDKKESTILTECGKKIFDLNIIGYITPTNDCVCFHKKDDGTTGVSYIPLINENSSDLCLGTIMSYDYGFDIGELDVLTNFKVSSDCENYQECSDYNVRGHVSELFNEELCNEDPCIFGNCAWDGNLCV